MRSLSRNGAEPLPGSDRLSCSFRRVEPEKRYAACRKAIVMGAGQSPGESLGNGRATVLRFAEEGAEGARR